MTIIRVIKIMKMMVVVMAATSIPFLHTIVGVAIEWSKVDVINLSPLSPSNRVSDVLQEQRSQLLGDSYDAIAEQTRQIRNQINDSSTAAAAAAAAAVVSDKAFEYEYLKNALDSITTTVPLSAEQLQIINDAVSMLGANYAYDAAGHEINLHRDRIAAAYKDLNNAARIVIDGSATTTKEADGDDSNWQRMRQVQKYVLSAVQYLQDSCPLCRALKYAARDANQNLLPFVTVLCSSILKTLHPFVANSS